MKARASGLEGTRPVLTVHGMAYRRNLKVKPVDLNRLLRWATGTPLHAQPPDLGLKGDPRHPIVSLTRPVGQAGRTRQRRYCRTPHWGWSARQAFVAHPHTAKQPKVHAPRRNVAELVHAKTRPCGLRNAALQPSNMCIHMIYIPKPLGASRKRIVSDSSY